MRKHAMLSASGADRWLVCTPSARLESELPETESVYADEGTLAHEFCFWEIRHKIWGVDIENKLIALKQNELYDESMLGYAEEFAEFIAEKYRKAPRGTFIVQERKFNLQEYIPKGFGTSDATLVGPGFIDVNDFKYGKGVPVDAYENAQMMIYGLGAYEEFNLLYPIDIAYLTIYQPRIENISTYEITTENLIRWGREVLRPTALRAYAGEGDFIPGDHCRFCKVKAICSANARLQLTLAAREFDPSTVTDEQIVKVLLRADQVKNWVKAVENYALKMALQGKKWPGLKLVEGRSNRIYADVDKIIKQLVEVGYNENELVNKKPIGITEMKKKISKQHMDAIVNPLLIKPIGKPTLTVEDDKRPEWDKNAAAAIDFEEEE
jgi:hypothetical protein